MLLKIWPNLTSLVAYLLLNFLLRINTLEAQNFSFSLENQQYQENQSIVFLIKKNNSDCQRESQTKAAIVGLMEENCCLDHEVSTSLVA